MCKSKEWCRQTGGADTNKRWNKDSESRSPLSRSQQCSPIPGSPLFPRLGDDYISQLQHFSRVMWLEVTHCSFMAIVEISCFSCWGTLRSLSIERADPTAWRKLESPHPHGKDNCPKEPPKPVVWGKNICCLKPLRFWRCYGSIIWLLLDRTLSEP